MIKITVSRIFSPITLLLFSLFGLNACAPIVLPRALVQLPQGYPVQQPGVVNRPAQQRPQPVVQRVQVVPKAGALVAAPVPVVKVARAPAVRTQQRPRVAPLRSARPTQQQRPRVAPARPAQQQVKQQIKVTVPPVLNPVQQARVSNAGKQNYNNYRPSASVARVPANQRRQPIWEDIPRKIAPARQNTTAVRRPSAAVRKPSIASRKNTSRNSTAVVKPAPQVIQKTPAKPTVRTQAARQATKPAQIEVLDLSGSVAKTTPTQENKTASVAATPSTYSSSPAVAILTKQANNQLTVGKAGRAAATLERALRIEPENPLLWLRLAEVNAQQGKKSQAASMARKALNMAPGDARLQARGQRLLN